MPQKWTLEYDIALGKLHNFIAIAIELAEKEKKEEIVTEELIKEVECHIASLKYEENNPNHAYEIFKPLNDGKVSKAITAQYLAFLLEKKDQIYIKEIINNDEHLSYLVDAINHVTSTYNG